MGLLLKAAPVADSAPSVLSPDDGASWSRPSLSALLLGVLMWLVVRPILRRITDLAACRRQMARLDWRAPFREGHSARLGGVAVHVIERPNAHRVVLYLHGGGFFMHPTGSHVALLDDLCASTDAAGVLPAYRLTPEHPFPQGLDDCLHVYQALLARGVPANAVVLAGESAGGTLVLSLLMRLRDAGLPLPACAVLISPGTDLAGVGQHASYRENRARDALVPPEALPRIVQAYAGDRDPAHPDLSPLHADFAGLPPLHFVASRHEVMRDDSVLAAAKARGAGVAVELRLWRGQMHAFPMFQRLPEARAARADIVRFIHMHSAERGRLQTQGFTDEVLP